MPRKITGKRCQRRLGGFRRHGDRRNFRRMVRQPDWEHLQPIPLWRQVRNRHRRRRDRRIRTAQETNPHPPYKTARFLTTRYSDKLRKTRWHFPRNDLQLWKCWAIFEINPYNPNLATPTQTKCSPLATKLQQGLFTRLQKPLFSKSNFIFPQSTFAIHQTLLRLSYRKISARFYICFQKTWCAAWRRRSNRHAICARQFYANCYFPTVMWWKRPYAAQNCRLQRNKRLVLSF